MPGETETNADCMADGHERLDAPASCFGSASRDVDEKVAGGVRGPRMFDFGIADLLLLGPSDQEVYLVEFRCRCAVVVARGQVIRRTRGFSLVCEHVSVGG